MVLSSLSRCMILTWGRSFDPLFPTSKADMWSSWVGKCCISWLPVLPSRMVIHEGLELNQIPILWRVKCPWERKEMDSHLERNLVFLFELHVLQLYWKSGTFLLLLFSAIFFREDDTLHSLLLIWFWNLWSFMIWRPFVGWLGTLRRFWVYDCGGNDAWQSWMPISEWMIDRLDILRQANNGYVKEKDR